MKATPFIKTFGASPFLLALCLAAAPKAGAQTYRYSRVGPEGTRRSIPTDINNAGTIIGSIRPAAPNPNFSFVKAKHGDFVSFTIPGVRSAGLNSINSQGTVIGSLTESNGTRHGFIANSDGSGARTLPLIDGLVPSPSAITANGLVFGNIDLTLGDSTSFSGKVVALDDSPLPNVVVQVVGIVDYECAMPGGFVGEYFQMDETFNPTNFPALPPDRAPTLKRVDAEINFRKLPETEPFARTTLSNHFCVRWTGAFRLSKAGQYTFEIAADSRAWLFIDGKPVMEVGYGTSPKQRELELTAGEHSLRLELTQSSGNHECQLHWWGEGAERSPFPSVKPARHTLATDEKGEYHFHQLPPARYQVRAHVPGGFIYSVAADVRRL